MSPMKIGAQISHVLFQTIITRRWRQGQEDKVDITGNNRRI